MEHYPRRQGGLSELRDGEKLTSDMGSVSPPMVRLSATCHAYLQEAVKLIDGRWLYPQFWFEQDKVLCGSGGILTLHMNGDSFVLGTTMISFHVSQILHSSICEANREIHIGECAFPIVHDCC